MNRLTAEEASAGVSQLDGWKVKDDTIMRRIKTRDFAEALRIANSPARWPNSATTTPRSGWAGASAASPSPPTTPAV